MTPKKARYIQIAGEAAIPLLGFFLWDWSLYFILLFYFIDMLIDECYTYVKHFKINSFHGESANRNFGFAIGSTTLLVVIIALAHFAMMFIEKDINFQNECWLFLTYEELGIPQGALLVPLLIFMAHQQYRMDFAFRGKERTMPIVALWKGHIYSRLASLALCLLALVMALVVELPEVVYLIVIVVSATAFQTIKNSRTNS